MPPTAPYLGCVLGAGVVLGRRWGGRAAGAREVLALAEGGQVPEGPVALVEIDSGVEAVFVVVEGRVAHRQCLRLSRSRRGSRG